MSVHTSSKEVKASEKGDAVVEYAKNFVGNRYRYGGSSLTNGTDCSGFTRGVYKKFGKRLPHSSSAQRRYGKKVKGGIKNAQAGVLNIEANGTVTAYNLDTVFKLNMDSSYEVVSMKDGVTSYSNEDILKMIAYLYGV